MKNIWPAVIGGFVLILCIGVYGVLSPRRKRQKNKKSTGGY